MDRNHRNGRKAKPKRLKCSTAFTGRSVSGYISAGVIWWLYGLKWLEMLLDSNSMSLKVIECSECRFLCSKFTAEIVSPRFEILLNFFFVFEAGCEQRFNDQWSSRHIERIVATFEFAEKGHTRRADFSVQELSNSEHSCLRGRHMFKRLAMFTMLHHHVNLYICNCSPWSSALSRSFECQLSVNRLSLDILKQQCLFFAAANTPKTFRGFGSPSIVRNTLTLSQVCFLFLCHIPILTIAPAKMKLYNDIMSGFRGQWQSFCIYFDRVTQAFQTQNWRVSTVKHSPQTLNTAQFPPGPIFWVWDWNRIKSRSIRSPEAAQVQKPSKRTQKLFHCIAPASFVSYVYFRHFF